MAPEFADMLNETPEAERTGLVLPLPLESAARVSEAVSEIGRAAGIMIDAVEGRFATAHDLRRSFGTRWAERIPPAALQVFMRHRSIETTMRYYVAMKSGKVAKLLWAAVALQSHSGNAIQAQKGDQTNDHAKCESS
jgi:integrase